MRTLALSLLSFLAFTPLALAAPVLDPVPGGATHGEPLTLSGSGFGAKATPGPLKYDSGEDRSEGDLVTESGWAVIDSGGSHPPTYTNFKTRPGSSRSIEVAWPEGSSIYTNSFGINADGYDFNSIYVDAWFYKHDASPQMIQQKLIRTQYRGGANQPNMYPGTRCDGWGGLGFSIEGPVSGEHPDTGIDYGSWQTGVPRSEWEEAWCHIQYYFRASDVDGLSETAARIFRRGETLLPASRICCTVRCR